MIYFQNNASKKKTAKAWNKVNNKKFKHILGRENAVVYIPTIIYPSHIIYSALVIFLPTIMNNSTMYLLLLNLHMCFSV